MKKILTILLVLLTAFAYGQALNNTNTKFPNGLAAGNGVTPKPTSGLTAGAIWYTTGTGFQVYNGSAWVTLGISGAGVTSFNTRTGAITLSSGDVTTALGYTPELPLTFFSPLVRNTNQISIPASNSLTNGYLSSTDWILFNSKGTVTSVGATAGTGISVSGSPITSSGSLTITNTAPSITITVTGTTDASGNFDTTAQGGTAQLIAVYEGAALTRPEYNSTTKVLSAMNPLTAFTAYFK